MVEKEKYKLVGSKEREKACAQRLPYNLRDHSESAFSVKKSLLLYVSSQDQITVRKHVFKGNHTTIEIIPNQLCL